MNELLIDVEFLGITLDVIGKLMISYTAIRIHYRVWKEHKIDERVFREMKNEQVVGVIGISFIVIGYALQFADRFVG